MICVSVLSATDWFGLGLRLPASSGRPSPAAGAKGLTGSATTTELARIHGPRAPPRRRLMMWCIRIATGDGRRELRSAGDVSGGHGVHRPAPGHAAQLLRPAVLEVDPHAEARP